MINRFIVKPRGCSGEGSFAWRKSRNNDTRARCRWYQKARKAERKIRIRSIRRRNPLKDEMPREKPVPWIW